MNREEFENNWKTIRSHTNAWWGLMADEDLQKVDKAPIKLEKYSTMLRVKYGYTRDQVMKEINDRVTKAGIEHSFAEHLEKETPVAAVRIPKPRKITEVKSSIPLNEKRRAPLPIKKTTTRAVSRFKKGIDS